MNPTECTPASPVPEGSCSVLGPTRRSTECSRAAEKFITSYNIAIRKSPLDRASANLKETGWMELHVRALAQPSVHG